MISGFGTDKDILLGNIYLPPSNSPYAYSDMFNDLELSLLELNYTDYYCLIAGDFNAHTLNKTDFTDLEEDLAQEIEVINCKEVLEANSCKVKRSNEDKTKCRAANPYAFGVFRT